MSGEDPTLIDPACCYCWRESFIGKDVVDPAFLCPSIGVARRLARSSATYGALHSDVCPTLLLDHPFDGRESVNGAIEICRNLLRPGVHFVELHLDYADDIVRSGSFG